MKWKSRSSEYPAIFWIEVKEDKNGWAVWLYKINEGPSDAHRYTEYTTKKKALAEAEKIWPPNLDSNLGSMVE